MPNSRALLTGIHGFIGNHLAAHLVQHGYVVSGIDLAPDASVSGVTVYAGDVRDPAFVREVVREVLPAYVFHLAALINPRADSGELYDVNVRGTESLLDGLRIENVDATILITGSSAVYGLVGTNDVPIDESQPFRPLNPYGVSKIAQEMAAYTHYARYGQKVIRTRTFNLVGPGQPPSLVCSAFAEQIAEIEERRAESVLRVGNLTPQRDFVDVRDAVCAYRLAAECGRPGDVYNVCSGRGVSIQVCLNVLLGLTKTQIRVEQDQDRMRPSDIPISVGDCGLLREETGWRPMIPLDQSLADLLDSWRQRMREMGQ